MDTRHDLHTAHARDDVSDDGAWGPTEHGGGARGRSRRRRRPWLRRVLLVLAVPLLVVAAYGGALAWHLNSSIERVDVPGRSDRTGGRINVLVAGSDSRADLTDDQRQDLTTGNAEGERTDSIMVLSARGGDVSLTSLPRDLWVTRCDGTQGRINAALGIDGPGCLVDTVEGLGDVPVHHWVEVDFGGFQGLVDAVGGVEICVDRALADPAAGIDLAAGCQRLDGATALGYVRTRKLDNDLERIRRQQEFVAALAREVATPATVLDPVRAWRTSGAVGAAIRADHDLGLVEFVRLVPAARAMAGGDLETGTVPGTPTRVGDADVLEPDLVAAEDLFERLRSDAASVDGPDAEEPLPAAGEVQVTVLNGGEIAGAAQATADALSALGYQVTEVDNAASRPTTALVVGAGGEAAAERLRRDLPVSPAIDLSGEVDGRTVTGDEVVLILGEDLDPTSISTSRASDDES